MSTSNTFSANIIRGSRHLLTKPRRVSPLAWDECGPSCGTSHPKLAQYQIFNSRPTSVYILLLGSLASFSMKSYLCHRFSM